MDLLFGVDVAGVMVWRLLSQGGYQFVWRVVLLAKEYSGLGKSIIKYIPYVHNIISIYPYTNFHI